MRYILMIAVLVASTSQVLADEWAPKVTDQQVQKECGVCHMAFQPAFLPAKSWDRMMGELSNHFGEDASLSANKVNTIRAYLTANAGDVKKQGVGRKYMRWVAPEGAPQRITENPAFLREHRFPDRVWQDPKIVTKSNCLACHPQADSGNYDD